MKILILNNSDKAIGGTEIYSGQLAEALRADSNEVILASRHWVQGPPIGEENPIIVDRRAALHKILADFKPDLIHINNPEAWFIELRLLKRFATIVFLHSPFPLVCPGDGRYHRQQERACQRKVGPYCIVAPWRHRCGPRNVIRQSINLALANQWKQFAPTNVVYVGASQWTCDRLRAEGFDQSRIRKTPLGLPNEKFEPSAATEAHPSPKTSPHRNPTPTILFVGRMIPVKGAAHLLRALEQVPHATNTIMVGDGPERMPLMEDATRNLPDRHQIDFRGWLAGDELAKVRRQADFVVMPSMWPEPFGLVGLEAFRAGKPVIAYDTGGISEWLSHKENGLLVEPGNIELLAQAINRLIEDRTLTKRLGEQGMKDQSERFTFENHFETMMSAYDMAKTLRR